MEVGQVQVNGVRAHAAQTTAGQTAAGKGSTFSDVLAENIARADAVRFSRHAAQRIESRNLVLTGEQMAKIRDSVDKAAAKGARESVLVMDSMALVVSIDNRTVITAMDRQDMKESIFTNVDSVAFI